MSFLKLFAIPVITVLLFTCLVQSTLFLPGQCPKDRPIEKNFDIQKYSGTWYEYYRKNDSYEYLGDCNTVTYTPHDNGTIGINRFSLLQEPVREQVEVEYAVFSDPEQKPLEGRWNISYQWNEPYFENHRIMETDYETYSITYICLPAGPDYSTDEFLIYTRKPDISEELETKISGIVGRHYNMTLLLKPKHNCQGKRNNAVEPQ